MKPITLKIEGLHSFATEQTVDFLELTKYGFFGIFGPTGSGKSTIIDAMTLALYGEIPRFDGERGHGQFINNNKDFAYVYFEFDISSASATKTYIVERSFKRTNDSIRSDESRLIEVINGKSQVIADKVSEINVLISNIIGLNYSDFTRTVVLPQGKFSDFLLLANSERRNMLERIFKLEKFGKSLTRKIRTEVNDVKTKLKIIDNSLEIYGDIKFEDIAENRILLDEEDNQLKILRKNYDELLNEESKLKVLKRHVDEYEFFQREFNKLITQTPEIELMEEKLDRGKEANILKPLINRFDSNEIKIQNILNNHKENTQDYKKNINNLIEYEESHTKVKEELKEKLPLLQEKVFKLKNAIDIEKENIVLLEQKTITDKEISSFGEEKKSLLENLEKFKTLITNQEMQKEKMKSIKTELYIDSDFQSKINLGYGKLIKYVESKESILKLIHKRNLTINLIDNDKSKLESILISLKEKHSFKTKLESELTNLNTTKVTVDETLNLQQEINLKEMLYNKYLSSKSEQDKNIEKLKDIQNKLDDTSDIIKNYEQINDSIEIKLENINKEIKESEQQNLILEISKTLKDGEPCPICGSKDHFVTTHELPDDIQEFLAQRDELHDLYDKNYLLFEEVKTESTLLNKGKSETEMVIDEMKKEIGSFNFDSEMAKIILLKSNYEEMKRTLNNQTKEKDLLELNISDAKDEINKINIDIARVKESINKEEAILIELLQEISSEKTLNNSFKEKLNQLCLQLNFYENDFSQFLNWKKAINGNNHKIDYIDKQKELLSTNLDNMAILVDNYKKELTTFDEKLNELNSLSSNLDILIGKNKNVIKNIAGDKNPATELDNTNNDIKQFEKEEGFYRRRLEDITKENQQLSSILKSLDKERTFAESISLELEIEIKEKIKEYNFVDKESALAAVIDKDTEDNLMKNIKSYYEKHASFKDNIARLRIALENKNVNDIETIILEMETRKTQINNDIQEKTEAIAILREKNNQLEKNYSAVEKLVQSKAEEEHQFDLLDDMAKLFAGSKFVEFISKKQLKYITREASERLKEMSNGRYALELKDTDFIIKDDFNGGIMRSPRTLSGGETFIASLCLALALSSKVQLNNANPLEFFFLDEGFGTLDLDSLDLVVTSLEKLRMENLTIGVISHSEELMSRIPVKLIVESSDQFGSGTKLKIENIDI